MYVQCDRSIVLEKLLLIQIGLSVCICFYSKNISKFTINWRMKIDKDNLGWVLNFSTLIGTDPISSVAFSTGSPKITWYHLLVPKRILVTLRKWKNR